MITTTTTEHVYTDFDLCTIEIIISYCGESIQKCKKECKSAFKQLESSLKKFNTIQKYYYSISSFIQDNEIIQKYSLGIEFNIKPSDSIFDFIDQFTDIPIIEIKRISFSVKNQRELENKAKEMAFKSAREEFANQCKLAGIHHDYFELRSWNVVVHPFETDKINIKADVAVSVTLNHVRK